MHPSFEAGFKKVAFAGLVARGVKSIGTSLFKNTVKGTAGAIRKVTTKAVKNPLLTISGGFIGEDILSQTKSHIAKTVPSRVSSRYMGG